MPWRRVIVREDLWEGEMIGLEVDGCRVVLLNADGRIVAYEDACPHQRVALSEGRFDGCWLVCRAHEWTYDGATGEGVNPRRARLRPIPVRTDSTAVWLDLPVPCEVGDES